MIVKRDALAGLVAGSGVALLAWHVRARPARAGILVERMTDRPNVTAAPPFRRLSESDKLVARLINAVNHDMRSLELGRWFTSQLATLVENQMYACSGYFRGLDAIPAKVPGANDITKKELLHGLYDLLQVACHDLKVPSHQELARVLRRFGRSACDPVMGVLSGMHGYALTSPVRLPP